MTYKDNVDPDFTNRQTIEGVDPLFTGRWSPRAFRKTEIADKDIAILFEAARWAPSCFNAQPWRFYVSTDNSFDDYLSLLVEFNQTWAKNASALCVVVSDQVFSHNGEANAWADFDTGAAWVSVAFQARKMGLYTHAMAGFDAAAAHKLLSLSESEKAICVFAIGEADQAAILDESLAEKEQPSERLPLSNTLIRR